MRVGGCPAGSSRALRLDPHCLPVRYAASDAAADGLVRHIELHRERELQKWHQFWSTGVKHVQLGIGV